MFLSYLLEIRYNVKSNCFKGPDYLRFFFVWRPPPKSFLEGCRLTIKDGSVVGPLVVLFLFCALNSDRHWGLSFVSSQCLWLQSTLVISNSKGLSEILRDIRTSTYQICRIEEKLIRLTTLSTYMCNWTPEVRDTYIENIVEKRRNCSLGAISPLFHNIFYMSDFHV